MCMPPFGWRLRPRKPVREKPEAEAASSLGGRADAPAPSESQRSAPPVPEDSLATLQDDEATPAPEAEAESTEGIPAWLVERLGERLPLDKLDSLSDTFPGAPADPLPQDPQDLPGHPHPTQATPAPISPHPSVYVKPDSGLEPPAPVAAPDASPQFAPPEVSTPPGTNHPAPAGPRDSFSSLETTQVHHGSPPDMGVDATLRDRSDQIDGGPDEVGKDDGDDSPSASTKRPSDTLSKPVMAVEQGTDEKTGRIDLSAIREIISEISPWSELPEEAPEPGTPQPTQPADAARGFDDTTPTSAYRGTFKVLEDGSAVPDSGTSTPEAVEAQGSDPAAQHVPTSYQPGYTLYEYEPGGQVAEDRQVVEALSAEWPESGTWDTAETPSANTAGALDTATGEAAPPPVEEHDTSEATGDTSAGKTDDSDASVSTADETPAWSQEHTVAWHGTKPSLESSADGDLLPIGELEPGVEAVMVAPGPSTRYRVLSTLGRGGAGLVTEVHDVQLDRPVALKMARTDLSFATAEERDAWLRRTEAALVYEARLTARLEDPRIVPVHDLGRTRDGRVFFTMKHVRGVSLGDILAGMAKGDEALLSEYSLNRRLTLFVQMCLGMAFAHDQGVIHRDLKPGNIMVGEYGTVQIIDWGLARFLDPPPDAPSLPKAIRDRDRRVIQGTPGYMAPEQALGDHDAVDHRTDIYALGAILYELLTFHSPIELTTGGDSLRARLYQLALGRFPSPSEAVPGIFVPPELDAICMKALAGEKAERFQDARSLAREVENYLEGTRLKEEATRLAERGRKLSEEYRALQGALREARRAARLARERTPRWAPVEDKEMLWALEDNEAEIAQRRTVTFADAVRAFHEALGYDRESTEARNGLAEIYWTRVVEMEEEGLVEEARYYEREARQYDTGALAERLAGRGKLILSSDPPGLKVDLFRYREQQRRLLPTHYASLERTPIERDGTPMGSYLATLHCLGVPDIQYPIWIRRGQTWEGQVVVPEQMPSQ